MLSEQEARTLMERVLRMSKAESCEVSVTSSRTGNVRFARNAVSTSGSQRNTSVAVESIFGKRQGVATINELDDASLERAVRRSEELARLAPEDPELMPPLGPQQYRSTPAFVEATAAIDPDRRAEAAAAGIAPAKERGCVAAGYLEHSATWQAMMNSAGLFAYAPTTNVNYTVTMRTEDGVGSGWANQDFNDVGRLDAGAVSGIALEKALASRNPRAIEPGKYTVILEPAASVDLLQQLIFNMDARNADEGRSFMSTPGGRTKLGERIVDERVTIYSDPAHPDAAVPDWEGDGIPKGCTTWVERGIARNLSYTRYWAQKQGKAPVANPGNLIIEGGSASLEELVRDTPRGVLVTRTWYIRAVDPQTLLFTGLTRDGTFYIENGRIRHAVKNMRFNESPVIMLNNVEALGAPVRIRNVETAVPSLIPPMRIRDFTFSSSSDAV